VSLPKITKTPLWVNYQVAGWRTEAGSTWQRWPVDVRIVSAHNDGNPHFAGEAVVITEAVAQEL